MKLNHAYRSGVRACQQGLALIVALVLLLVMTMVAVVAMRSTTLDLKMSSNTTQTRRAFQSSEAARLLVGPIVGAHCRASGWPVANGGTVSGVNNFVLPTEVELQNPTKLYYLEENGTLAEATATPPTRTEDIRFRSRVGTDDEIQMDSVYADAWVSFLGHVGAAGTQQNTGTGYQAGGTGAGVWLLFDIRALGRAGGNAAVLTSSDYRYVP